jgi:hypothetical protein
MMKNRDRPQRRKKVMKQQFDVIPAYVFWQVSR